MSRSALSVAGLLLAGLCCLGFIHAVRTAKAQVLYYEAKYGASSLDRSRSLDLCERSRQLYPQNYYLYILAGEGAYHASFEAPAHEAQKLRETATTWCDAGLQYNSYNSQLRFLKVNLLADTDLPAAIAMLEEYVDWNYWSPANHFELVKLYVRSGDLDKAFASCKLLEGRAFYTEATALLKSAWKREKLAATNRSKPEKQRKP